MRNAEAVAEWSQLEDEKKATMRATAKRLMDEMHHKQAMHDKVMAAARERVENATSDVARKLFKDDIRLHEENHAKELQQLEEQASQALATIDRDFSSRAEAAQQSAAPRPTAPAAAASPPLERGGSAKRMTVSSSREQLMSSAKQARMPQSEARLQAISWLETSERNSERDSDLLVKCRGPRLHSRFRHWWDVVCGCSPPRTCSLLRACWRAETCRTRAGERG